jgi:polysaccharide export outer membrane protein
MRNNMKSKVNRALLFVVFLAAAGCTLSAQAPASEPDGSGPMVSSATSPGNPPLATPAQPATPVAGKPHDDSFVIGADDVLAINVWKETDVSRSVPVRSDGKISLPLVGEIVAAGKTPLQLEQDITARLRSYITEPEVTVMVQQINSEKYNILGQVTKPGSYPLVATTTIVDAIATAGGFRDFAKKKGIYVLRQNPEGGESRIGFSYPDYIKGKSTSQNIALKPHDTVIVP